jgi:hypothetical protein
LTAVFKRLLWLCIGMGFGFGASFFVVRAMRRTIERYTPERVSSDLSSALTQLGRDIKAAVAEGRAAMAEREAELWGEIERGHDPFGGSSTLAPVDTGSLPTTGG